MKRDLIRIFWLLVLGLVMTTLSTPLAHYLDPSLAAVFYSIGVVILLAGASHVTRRILMPRLDMQEFARKALLEPLPSAIVFAGFCLLLSVLILAGVLLMK